jgi:hypothetical protein
VYCFIEKMEVESPVLWSYSMGTTHATCGIDQIKRKSLFGELALPRFCSTRNDRSVLMEEFVYFG